MTYSEEPDNSAFFGKKKTTPSEKSFKVNKLFDRVTGNYDLMNDIMSLRMHRFWKDQFVKGIELTECSKIVDLASGTGDILRSIIKKYRYKKPTIYATDLSHNMLIENRNICINKGFSENQITWVNASGETLPYNDNSFDAVTLSFGLRNFGSIANGLKDIQRILKPGGKLYCLEFSHPPSPTFAKLFEVYNQKLLPIMGQIFAKNRNDYQYLADSIETFPDAETLKGMCLNAGFKSATFKHLSGGIVAIHEATAK